MTPEEYGKKDGFSRRIMKTVTISEIAFVSAFVIDWLMGKNLSGDFALIYRFIVMFVLMGFFSFVVDVIWNKVSGD